MPSKQLAKVLGLLPQSPVVPEGITVWDLVSRGRFPYQTMLKSMSKEDFEADGIFLWGVGFGIMCIFRSEETVRA